MDAPVSKEAFKRTLSRLASGVTVVTTALDGTPHGATISAFNSVSLDPPLVMFCALKTMRSHAIVLQSGVFAVNILADGQEELGLRFASSAVTDRFAGLVHEQATTGAPILGGCLAWVDCTLRHAYDAGDHTIFVGEVVACSAGDGGEPLLYYDRNWRTLAPLGSAG